MRAINALIVLLFVTVFMVGCTSTKEKGGQTGNMDASTSGYSDTGITGTELQGLGPDGGMMEGSLMGSNAELMGGEFGNPQSPLSKQIIYLMFDSSQIHQVFQQVVDAHAQYLSAHPGQRVILEGHADERGSREYNVALSEQRAKAVARLLEMKGVSPSQLDLVSYGEEKPAVFENDEAAWQQNRRVEIVYQAQ